MMNSHSALSAQPQLRDFTPQQALNYVLPRAGTQQPSPAGHLEVPVDQLRFCHLRTPRQIAEISHLRREIRLPDAVLADSGFDAREKKETSWGW